jgi:prepilin peptidase CpaA
MLIHDNHIALLLLIMLLVLVTVTDIKSHRIPNILTFGGALVGIGLHILWAGSEGLLIGFYGFTAGLLLLLPFHLFGGGMAAGDVKLMAAAGAFLGPKATLIAVCSSLIVGSLLGIGFLVLRGGLMSALRRYFSTMKCFVVTGTFSYVPPHPSEAAASKFPYAVAIAMGTVITLLWLA